MSEEGGAEKRRKRHIKPPGLSQWQPICLSASPWGNIGVQYSGYSGLWWIPRHKAVWVLLELH